MEFDAEVSTTMAPNPTPGGCRAMEVAKAQARLGCTPETTDAEL